MRDAGTLVATAGVGLLAQACLIVSGVMAARTLGVEDRGYLALVILFPTVLAELGSLGIPQAAAYWLAAKKVAPRRLIRRLVVPFAAQVAVLLALQVVLIRLVLADEPRAVLAAGYIALAATPAGLAVHYGLGLLQGEDRFRDFNAARLLMPAMYALGALVIPLVPADALILFSVAWVMALVVTGAFALVAAWRRLPPDPTPSHYPQHRELVTFGLRGLLGTSSPLETLRPDQAVLVFAFQPAALGLYVVALSLTNLPRFIGQSIGLVAFPRTARSGDIKEVKENVWRFTLLAAAACIAIGGVLELAAPWIIGVFFGSEFEGAVVLARILVLAAVFTAVRRVLADAARGAGHPGAGSVAELAMWIVLLPALVLFSSLWDEEGVALAVLAASVVSCLALLGLVVRRLGAGTPRTSWRAENAVSVIGHDVT